MFFFKNNSGFADGIVFLAVFAVFLEKIARNEK